MGPLPGVCGPIPAPSLEKFLPHRGNPRRAATTLRQSGSGPFHRNKPAASRGFPTNLLSQSPRKVLSVYSTGSNTR